MEEPGRAVRMGERLRRTAHEVGLPQKDVELLATAHALAMAPRVAALSDDHDPAYLHPGRTAAILLDDLAMLDAGWVAAGMLLDTGRPDLEAQDEVLQELPPELLERRCSLPRPGSETLVEDLLSLQPVALNVALAERLDHLRHIHLWADVDAAARVYAHAAESYSRVAARSHPKLARRYAWWTRTFGRKFPT